MLEGKIREGPFFLRFNLVKKQCDFQAWVTFKIYFYIKSYKFLFCLGQTSWPHGSSLINYMKLMQFNGLSGMVRFDSQGVRTDFDLDVMELQVNNSQKVFFLLNILSDNFKGWVANVRAARKHVMCSHTCACKKTSKTCVWSAGLFPPVTPTHVRPHIFTISLSKCYILK